MVFINVLCTKQICLVAEAFVQPKSNFMHLYTMPLKSALVWNPVSCISYLTFSSVHINCLSFYCSLILSFWKHICFALLHISTLATAMATLHPRSICKENSNPALQHFLVSKTVSITQWGHSRSFSDIASFIWQFSNHWGHKVTPNCAFTEGQSSAACPALYRLKYQIVRCKKVLAINILKLELLEFFRLYLCLFPA